MTSSAPRSRPAASSSAEAARMTRRASMPGSGGRVLSGVPGERDGGAVALVAVVRGAVERDAELVAVLGARGEAAEARDGVAGRAHLRQRAGVDGGVVAVAAGRRGGAGVGAAVA